MRRHSDHTFECSRKTAKLGSSQSALASKSGTKILYLNDDCLEQVFSCIEPESTSAIADVCSRFRRIAQAQYTRSKYKIDTYNIEHHSKSSLIETAKVLRLYGASIKMICIGSSSEFRTNRTFCENSLELVNRYCCPVGLTVHNYDMNKNSIECLLRPLLPIPRTLCITFCEMSDVFVNALLDTTPELEQLEFNSSGCYKSIKERKPITISQPKSRKLTKITFRRMRDNNSIEEFLRWNPQLKHIEFDFCPYLNDYIFRTIVGYASCVETIKYKTTVPTSNRTIKYFGQLKCLKSLDLCVPTIESSSKWIVAVLQGISAENVPIENIRLENIIMGHESDRFVDEIAKLEKLTLLKLKNIDNLSVTHVLKICRHLSKLTEFHFRRENTWSIFSVDNLLELIQISKNMRVFCYRNFDEVEYKIRIDAAAFKQMIKASTHSRRHLKIGLSERGYTAEIPDELIRVHDDLLTISLEKHYIDEIERNPQKT